MRRIPNIIVILSIVLPMLASCRAISRFLNNDDIVAEVDGVMLLRSDLDEVMPDGLSAEDSTRLAVQYINTWATDIVFQKIAEQQLSKAEKDVTKELEDYRKSLLKYRYEQLYINERLDTAVTDELVDEYYNAHADKFVLQRPVMKARFLSIYADSPGLEPIRKRMSSSDVEDLVEADSLAYSSAMKFTTWNDEWIDVSELSMEFGMDYQTFLEQVRGNWVEKKDTTGLVRLAYISEMKRTGEMAPIEYSAPSIKDMIVSARKQELVNGLEQDLLNDARENGKFKIYR
jgi:hypothetical protein